MVIEKHKTIAATMLPKPANGTPKTIQEIVSPTRDNTDTSDMNTPNIETHAKGRVL
jgi:hypothetical protein